MAFKHLVVSISTFIVIFLLGCSPEPKEPTSLSPSPEPSKASHDPVKILLMTKSQSNPYYVMMEQGARKAADELGITLIAKGTPNETYVALQKKMLLGAVDEGFDAIVFVPSKTTQLLPILKQVQDQGMVLVNLDDQINAEQANKVSLEPIPFVGINNEAAAQEMAERVLENNPDMTSAYIILGPQSSSVSHARANGFRAALQKHQRQLLGEETANWQYVEAYELSERLLREYPDIDAFFCANDVMALAITQQLQDKGRTDVKVIGYDAIPEAKSLVQQGKMEATLDQQSYQQGEIGVHTAVKLLNGETVDAESWVSPELILNRD